MAERLILIRHGDLGDRRRGRYIGRTDAPLSAEGRRQAAALAGPLVRLLNGVSLLVSPLRRTIETAERALGRGANFAVDSDLREIDFGRWEGMGFAEILAADPAGTAVVFTHGGVIRFLICHFLGLPDRAHLLFDVQPASISEIRIDGGKGVLTLLNDRRHLEMD